MIARFDSKCGKCHGRIVAGSSITPGAHGFYVHSNCGFTHPVVNTPVREIPSAPLARPFVGVPMDADELNADEYRRHLAARRLGPDDIGPWVARDDSIYTVRSAKGDGGEYYFGQKWDGHRFNTKDASGHGWTGPVARMIAAGQLRKMTEDEAAEFVSRTGWCPVHCGLLTNKDSVDAGVGPICAERMGWDRLGMAKANRAARAARIQAARDAEHAAMTPDDKAARYAELFGDDEPPAQLFAPDGTPVPTDGLAAMPLAFQASPEAAANAARTERVIEEARQRAKSRRQPAAQMEYAF